MYLKMHPVWSSDVCMLTYSGVRPYKIVFGLANVQFVMNIPLILSRVATNINYTNVAVMSAYDLHSSLSVF